MNAIEIVLLIVGFISISVSFFIGNKNKDKEMNDIHSSDGASKSIWTKKEEELVRDQIHSILAEEKENTIVETTDYLNRKSNEKIMEFDEFSSQILEKINQNHNEVVFMYSMLTDKETEIKEDAIKKTEKAASKKVVSKQPVVHKTGLQSASKVKKKEQTEKKPVTIAKETVDQSEQKDQKEQDTNNQIIQMYRQGKSALDISRELKIGQGEVKLMISLYGGKKK